MGLSGGGRKDCEMVTRGWTSEMDHSVDTCRAASHAVQCSAEHRGTSFVFGLTAFLLRASKSVTQVTTHWSHRCKREWMDHGCAFSANTVVSRRIGHWQLWNLNFLS